MAGLAKYVEIVIERFGLFPSIVIKAKNNENRKTKRKCFYSFGRLQIGFFSKFNNFIFVAFFFFGWKKRTVFLRFFVDKTLVFFVAFFFLGSAFFLAAFFKVDFFFFRADSPNFRLNDKDCIGERNCLLLGFRRASQVDDFSFYYLFLFYFDRIPPLRLVYGSNK